MVPENGLLQDKDMMQWAFEKYNADFDQSGVMVKGVMERLFTRLMKRSVYAKPKDRFPLNGCCVPGQRKNFIEVDGTIHICERMPHKAPTIGHVDTGFDMDAVKKIYIHDYAETSLKECSRCWGLRLCDICYYSAYNAAGEPDMEKKRKFCDFNLKSLQVVMRHFVSLLVKNPGRLDYLNKHEIK
jgi:uncharacterized protein